MQILRRLTSVTIVLICATAFVTAQEKGQWVPGQFGLNAGVIPSPGFTYANLAINYSAPRLNDPNGNPVKPITGTYSFWVDENILYMVPNHKFFGAYYIPYIAIPAANGSLVADVTGTNLNLNGGGAGYADTFFEPVNLGWHFEKRLDFNAGYAFVVPTGRYTPGASNNVGSGYWGNQITTGSTLYLTKNQGTSANLVTDWEIHGQKIVGYTPTGASINKTPGQTFTIEWGLGQVLPLKKNFSQLAQLGVVGYDQWQVSDNGGTQLVGSIPIKASSLPYYSSHAIGGQINYIVPGKALLFFFKYYSEYLTKSSPQGREFVFGGSWTIRIPKPVPAHP